MTGPPDIPDRTAAPGAAEPGAAALPSEHGITLPALDTADVPRATYRMQFHAGHTFTQARAAIAYLAALGVSHLYSSPYLMARPGSTHGYDVIDPTRINPEIGTDEDHDALCAELAAHGMGQLLDVVPNHMAVLEACNPWWDDVLEHGEASAHARTFDIEWQSADPELQGRVLLPVLDDHYGRTLEAGRLQLQFDADAGRIVIRHGVHRFPIDPRDYPAALSTTPMPPAGGRTTAQATALLDAFARLPSRDTPHAGLRAARLRDAPRLQRDLAALVSAHRWLGSWITGSLQQLDGKPGEPASFDALDALLRRQAFRLAHWRVASDDINYRRFFDINALAAVRTERPPVFEATHRCILRWLAQGRITGLRVDHPDGLSRPLRYFRTLQQRHAALARTAGTQPRALYLVVEKILADHERLPGEWPVHGDTGYRFSSLVNGLFIDPHAEAALDRIHETFTGDTTTFEHTIHDCKALVIHSSFAAELGWLTETLYRITRADRMLCDFTRNRLRNALAEIAAAFPVYRTYVGVDSDGPSDADRRHVAWALAAAGRQLERTETELLACLEPILLGARGPAQTLRERFVQRWQQFTAPVMAKAVEDTAFYRHVRLASLNDVGTEPRRFGVSIAAFHHANVHRAQQHPHALLATSTHDSKRSEDVRARLNVLSEMPAVWGEAVLALDAAGDRFLSVVDGSPAPSAHDRWTLFQALAGIWPAGGASAGERESLLQRTQQYVRKAMREAKRDSHWLSPNEAYEQAAERYVAQVLALDSFVQPLEALVRDIAPQGFRNSLAQLALKMTVPGVPDIYQGCEQWNFSLVDPDNRRPVNFDALAGSLEGVQRRYADGGWPGPDQWRELLPPDPGPELKLLVTWRLLQLRRAQAALFRDGTYLPLSVEGPSSDHALAFARIHDGCAIVVVAGRWLHRLEQQGWRDTVIDLSGAHPVLARCTGWQNWMTGALVSANGAASRAQTLLGDIGLRGAGLPFAVLVQQAPP